MTEAKRAYLPAAGRDWALPLYDPLVKLLGGDAARRALIDRADLRPGQRVLEIGCGTGSLLVQIKRLHPDTIVVGLDPDPKALARARRKARSAALAIQVDEGFADRLPYPDASFDRVFSSFMFHHLAADEKDPTLREVRRVLGADGRLYLLDFAGRPGVHWALARVFHSHHRLEDNTEDRIVQRMRNAGFTSAAKVREGTMIFGAAQVAYYEAIR